MARSSGMMASGKRALSSALFGIVEILLALK